MIATLKQLQDIVSLVKFHEWKFLTEESGSGYFLQVIFDAPDADTGNIEEQRCRKWLISKHATHQEVVRTAYLAVLQALTHEVQEGFLYRGAAIFNPHISPDALWDVAEKRVYREVPNA